MSWIGRGEAGFIFASTGVRLGMQREGLSCWERTPSAKTFRPFALSHQSTCSPDAEGGYSRRGTALAASLRQTAWRTRAAATSNASLRRRLLDSLKSTAPLTTGVRSRMAFAPWSSGGSTAFASSASQLKSSSATSMLRLASSERLCSDGHSASRNAPKVRANRRPVERTSTPMRSVELRVTRR